MQSYWANIRYQRYTHKKLHNKSANISTNRDCLFLYYDICIGFIFNWKVKIIDGRVKWFSTFFCMGGGGIMLPGVLISQEITYFSSKYILVFNKRKVFFDYSLREYINFKVLIHDDTHLLLFLNASKVIQGQTWFKTV